jgi:organic hydroperoxide reductase OsmC/OhrA
MYPCIQYWSREGCTGWPEKSTATAPPSSGPATLAPALQATRLYERAHIISAPGKAEIAGSSDQSFRGDASRWNPEDLLVASASTCHMLWYLHLCAGNDVVVLDYRDEPEGLMIEEANGSGAFSRITLRPRIKLAASSSEQRACELHHEAHRMCFIANSVRCEIITEPVFSR